MNTTSAWPWRYDPDMVEPDWAQAVIAEDRRPQPTRPHWRVLLGQRVCHPIWGAGHVIALLRGGFARIAFDAGDERLVHVNRLTTKPMLRAIVGGKLTPPQGNAA